MPEDQNFRGNTWSTQLNGYLHKVLQWSQLGTSNIDVACGKPGHPLGLDSVFFYRSHDSLLHQVVVVEAKTRATLDSCSRSKLQDWVDRLLEKVDAVPTCTDFQQKFAPPDDAQFGVGLMGLWIDGKFDRSVLLGRLEQLELPERTRPQRLFVLDNAVIGRSLAVHEETTRLLQSGDYRNLELYLPPISSDLLCNGRVVPLEYLFSDIMFYRVQKRQYVLATKDYSWYEAALCFYFGDVQESIDLDFIELAIHDSGLQQSEEIDVYMTTDASTLRSQIDAHGRKSSFRMKFHTLQSLSALPEWLVEK